MFNKRDVMIRLGNKVISFGAAVSRGFLGSIVWVGEPKLPKKFQK